MKHLVAILSFCVCLSAGLQARCSKLPNACGDDRIQFDVKTQKNHPAPAPPAEGKAQIVFVENENQMVAPFSYATVRFGMDGAWVGADYGNSYFAVDVASGIHHLCASWQGVLGWKKFGLVPLTAEPGKVYYFAAQVTVESESYSAFGLSQLNDDEGKYRVNAFRLSTWKPKSEDEN
jgi:hypothetical protein